LLARIMAEYLPAEYPYEIANADQSVKAEDFDDRVDVIPVSNPNIFSQAQRIALAQTQMELASQAPDMHNRHEAFRRMYEALGVRDIDKILKAPSTEEPQPKDPAQENIDSLEATGLRAFEGQNHDAHIMTHLVFGASGIVQASPEIAVSMQKHIMEHVKIKAQEQAQVVYMQQMQQGQIPQPQSEQEQMMQLELITAQLIAEGMQEVKALGDQVANAGEEQGPDPLIALKQQELQIKGQKTEADIAMDQAELQLDQEKEMRKAGEFQQRLQSQEDQTAARIQSALDREQIRQQNQNRGPRQ